MINFGYFVLPIVLRHCSFGWW